MSSLNYPNALAFACFLFAGTCFAQDSKPVILAGTGQSPHLQTVLDGISDALSSSGVKAKVISGESKARSAVLDDMKSSGLSTLLYISVYMPESQRGNVVAQLFIDGKEAWQEKITGPIMPQSDEKYLRSMIKSINQKLSGHIGGPGFRSSERMEKVTYA